MATYYFFICEECKEAVQAVSDSAHPVLMSDANVLAAFLAKHALCVGDAVMEEPLRLIRDESFFDRNDLKEWTKHNFKDLLNG